MQRLFAPPIEARIRAASRPWKIAVREKNFGKPRSILMPAGVEGFKKFPMKLLVFGERIK
jgi:hypothetical protein